MLTWLGACQASHADCSDRTDRKWYPTRLIAVSSDSTAKRTPDAVHLVLPGEDTVAGPYATLSHCWGKGEFLKLSQNTLDEMR